MHDNDDFWMFIGIVFIIITAIIVWKFSLLLNVNLETGFSIFLGLIGVAALYLAAWQLLNLSLSETWPILLPFVISSFFPALDYWSLQATNTPEIFKHNIEPQKIMWYANQYFKLGIFFISFLPAYFKWRN